jgi:signal transduction histidine kinase
LEHAYEQLQAATEQMRSVAESRLSLLRAATHELRNAMQPVTLAAETLLEESNLKNREEVGKQLAAVASRLQALLDRLLKLSSILSGEARVRLVPVAFSKLLGDLERDHRPAAEKKGLRFQAHQSIPFAETTSDPDKLREIGDVLLSNAIRHTTSGFIRLEVVGAEPHRWILRVTDSGSGIDPIDAHQIFTEFHSRNPSAPGLRLGLILARHLARLLGGEVTFQSTIGEGSCFEVNLPRVLREG